MQYMIAISTKYRYELLSIIFNNMGTACKKRVNEGGSLHPWVWSQYLLHKNGTIIIRKIRWLG